MGDIVRDSEVVELHDAPRFEHGERVASRCTVRNDGTYPGREVGDLLVSRGDVGIVRSIGTFLQQFYIYEVEFVSLGVRVGMKGRELVSLEKLPEHVQAALGAERLAELSELLHHG